MDPISLEDALEKKCKNLGWVIWITFLTASPTIFNAAHLTSYVFLGGDPSFLCNVPELVEANWTKEQIREISSPGLEKQSCIHYYWNYTLLKELGFDGAVIYTNTTPKPDVVKCNNGYLYEEEEAHQTLVSEWDLVCDDYSLRSTAQNSVAIGKLPGALFFGLISDRFGRKKTFIFSAILCMVAEPATALVNSYVMFILFRMLTGFSNAGIYEISYTLLLELTVKKYRTYLGNISNTFYSFGLIYLPIASYYTKTWRQLQWAISIPMFILLLHCCFLPESPRWLITKGKLEKAADIIGSVGHLNSDEPHQISRPDTSIKSQFYSFCLKLLSLFNDFIKLFSTLELAKRTLICNYLCFFLYLYFYITALNGTNFGIDQRLYIGLNGVTDIPGFLLPILLLTYFGRRSSGITLFSVAVIAMVAITVLQQGWPVMCMALVGRIVGTAGIGVIMFYTLELFPTEIRNTAMGTCITSGHFGPLLAPYIVDTLGKKHWWVPTVLCGSLALLSAILLLFLPETRNTPMLDTIKEMKKQEKVVLNDCSERSS